jgi:hypothetical protein
VRWLVLHAIRCGGVVVTSTAAELSAEARSDGHTADGWARIALRLADALEARETWPAQGHVWDTSGVCVACTEHEICPVLEDTE